MLTITRPPTSECRFRAMGSDAHVVVVGGDPGSLDRAQRSVRSLEALWSRFLGDSEISFLNRHAGVPVVVSAPTFDLVRRAIAAWHLTGGRFDPTVGAALVAHGYDRDLDAVHAAVAPAPASLRPAPGAGAIVLDEELHAVTLPTGTVFDPGGIGKGLAADLVATALVTDGAAGALVNVGGDLRVVGQPPAEEGWVVTVPDADGEELLRLALDDGGVATSSRLGRRWATTSGPAHHLVDPRTGAPTTSSVLAVTVVAAEAWRAEVLTKVAFVSGAPAIADLVDAHALVLNDDGTRHVTSGLAGLVR